MSDWSFWDILFGAKKDTKEILREYTRIMDRAIRQLDRDIERVENYEFRATKEMKEKAKLGQVEIVRSKVRECTKYRNYRIKFEELKTQLATQKLKLMEVSNSYEVMNSLKLVTKSMRIFNNKIGFVDMKKIQLDMERQAYTMGLKEEMMGEMTDPTDTEKVDEDELFNQIIEEASLDEKYKLKNIKIGTKKQVEMIELEKRLEDLKK